MRDAPARLEPRSPGPRRWATRALAIPRSVTSALSDEGAGFPRARRLTSAAHFGRVFANPLRSSDRYFTLLARDNDGAGARLGLAVSRRAAAKAVDRNRLKRLARESFRAQPALAPLDFVVVAKPGAAQASNQPLRESLDRHFERLSRKARSTDAGSTADG